MQVINGFDFYSLNFDGDGNLTDGNEFPAFKQGASGLVTDAIFIAHGFRNDVNDATTLYTNFLGTFRGHLARPEFAEIAKRKFIVGAVFWPSKALPESFGTGSGGGVQSADADTGLQVVAAQKLASLKDLVPEKSAALDQAAALVPLIDNSSDIQDQFTSLVLSALDGSELDPTEGLSLLRQQKGSDMLPKLVAPVILPTSKPDSSIGDDGDIDGDGGTQSISDGFDGDAGSAQSIGSVFGSVLGGVDKFLNLTTWCLMKTRSGTVGATGVAQAVRDTHAANGNIKIHLVGHSLGGRLMAACAKSLAQDPKLQPDSMTLLEAAFSHYGFSPDNGKGTPGFFRDVIAKQIIKGPMVETFSYQDTVVGITYALASRLANDNVKAIGDANDEFGGIGRNGCQKTTESFFQPLKSASTLNKPYSFNLGIVNCVDGSGGLIKDHSDVTNADVTYAFASAVANTGAATTASAGASL